MKLLADHFEDWHDILEVSVSDAGIPVALSYRVKHTLGLMLSTIPKCIYQNLHALRALEFKLQ